MLWVTWRQHRAELLTAVAVLVLAAVPLIWTGLAMHAEYRADGVADCVGNSGDVGDTGAACERLVDAFTNRYAEWGQRLMWAAFVPGIAGVFIGAPLLARELEQGTWRLAFTQSVSRTRWLVTRLTVVGAAVAATTATVAALLTWWRAPIDDIYGRMRTTSFVIAVPSLTTAAVFAFALGVLAGAVLRHTVTAMAATLVGFVAVRVGLEEYGRPHYGTPLVRVTDPGAEPTGPRTDWTVTDGWIDRAGHVIPDREQAAVERHLEATGEPVARYMLDHGLRHRTEYFPDSSFWTFQAIEAAVFLGLAGLLLATTVHLVRRHY